MNPVFMDFAASSARTVAASPDVPMLPVAFFTLLGCALIAVIVLLPEYIANRKR